MPFFLYIYKMKCINVVAERITPTHIYYACPDCKTKYKQNGEPYKNAKPVYHIHGNETHGHNNRTTERSHHKVQGCKEDTYDNVIIVINNNTLKLGFEDGVI